MRAIATRLDGLPLALVIAGVFIRNTGMGFAQYLHYYENSWNRLQSKGEPQRHYFNGNLLATWNISLVEIQKRDPFAVNLLRLLSHFDNRDIWFELLECGLDVDNKPEWVNEMMGDEFSFLKTMKILVSFSFVHVNHENSSYSLHPVIQDWCRHGLTQIEVNDDSNNDKLKEIALVSVGYCVPGTSTKEYWILQQRLLPHANRMVNTIQNGWHIPQNYALINAIGYLGDLYSNQGLLNEAESMYKISLSSKKSFLGENHGSVLNSTQSLAILYVAQGKDNDAEPLFHRVLEGRENSVGSEALATLTAANNLGRFYFDRGEISKAEALFQRALTGFEKTVGPTNKATLLAIYNLAGVFLDQQKWDEAESMYLRSLSGREKLYGPGHPVTLRTVNNLGMLYQRQKRTQEAEKMYRRALEGKEKTLGVNHRVTMRSALLLGKLFREQGRYDEAEVMFRRVLVAYTKTFGQDHVKTTRAAEDLRRTVQMKSREIENAIED
jgi:tetratricopeptide (TPR) repeat protein